MTTKPEVTARSSVLRGVVSRSPPAHNQPQHHVANEREATAASESSTSPVTISAILSWRGGSATGSLNHISRIAGEQFWSSPKEWRLTTYIRRYTSNTMSATIILGAQWGDEGKVRQLSPPLQGQEPLALDRWAGHIYSLTRIMLTFFPNRARLLMSCVTAFNCAAVRRVVTMQVTPLSRMARLSMFTSCVSYHHSLHAISR